MTGRAIAVIGGGPAGMMAALTARRAGADVLLLERNPKLGRKLYITGKGRCNLTNACGVQDLLPNVVRNGRFLYSALSAFPPQDAMAFFEGLGVPLKVERGNRVFPVSDRASDVVDALYCALRRSGVRLIEDRAVGLTASGGALTAVRGEKETYPCAAAVLATGGLSYPATGSTGDGYDLARSLGHTVTPLLGSLVPLEAPECGEMQGLSLKNISLTVKNSKNKAVFSQQGELLFTHFGLSGPLVLSASAHLRDFDRECYTAHIDLKPALTPEQLEARFLRELQDQANRDMGNYVLTLVPRLMAPLLLRRAEIGEHLKVNSLTKPARQRLLALLKDLSFPIVGPRPIAEAIVTAGGVSVKEVDPRTMASKLCNGLYLAGELLDVDAYTGGFSLQIAWSTGYAAGLAAAQYVNGGGSQ